MALFGNSRDIAFFKNVNRELLDDVIQQEIDFYQLSLEDTESNMYGEATKGRVYYRPVRLSCLIEREDVTSNQDDQFGIDVTQNIIFKFFKPRLRDLSLVPKTGDIIEVRGAYYEVDNVNENQFVLGKDGDYGKNVGPEFGESFSVICNTHLARTTRLQIVKARN